MSTVSDVFRMGLGLVWLCACVESPTEPVRRDAEPSQAEEADAGTIDSASPAEIGAVGSSGDGAAPSMDGAMLGQAQPPACTQASCAERPETARCGASGSCEPCQSDGDCRAVPGLPSCSMGSCVACTSDAQCTTPGSSVCDPTTHRCVGCLSSSQCPGATASRCGATRSCEPCTSAAECAHIGTGLVCGSGKCVECASDGDCKDPSRSACSAEGKCTPCSEASDCAHFSDTKACASGRCVQCTREQRSACAGAVCNALTNQCGTAQPASAELCDACVSDDQCKPGQRCVQPRAGEAGSQDWYCQWQRGAMSAPAMCGGSSAPFASERAIRSIESATMQPTCTLSVGSCPAYRAFREPCGRYGTSPGVVVAGWADEKLPPDVPRAVAATAAAIKPDDTVCGQGGKCTVAVQETGSYRCTVPCLSNDDCDPGAACQSGANGKVCSVN
jgi:hypothetical protein